ncbi:hypothetical protein OH77DRAFT_1414305, partial [Trametes cingulata]
MPSNGHTTLPASPLLGSDFSSVSSSRSIMDMPVEGTKLAPKVFRGDPGDVEPFLRRFERLAVLHNLTDREKCETVTDYCSKVIRETIEGFTAYQQGNWGQLKANIRIFWNADLESKRFRIRDLQAFTAKSRKQSILELRDWRKYLRRFIRIAGWLQGQRKLSDTDYAYYLWTGLPSSFRRRLEARLLMEDPHHDMSEPFDPENIQKAAEALLGVDRFDMERLGTGALSDDDESDEEEDDFSEVIRPRASQSQRYVKGRRSLERFLDDDDSDTEELEASPRRAAQFERRKSPEMLPKAIEPLARKGGRQKFDEEREFTELVDKMQKMSLSDPQYGFLYLKICAMKPIAAECLPKPIAPQPRNPVGNRQRGPPPHLSQANTGRLAPGRPPMTNSECFGCGESGHIIRDCPIMTDYQRKGYVMRDYRGRWTRSDGSLLWRNPDETWVQAVKRIMPEVHYVTERQRQPLRQSQLNREVDSDAILKRILDSELTLSVREVVGVSKDISNRLQDALKVKRADFVAPPVSNLVTTHAGALIRVEVECNQKPVSFIVDTGSQLNLISEKVCKNIVRRPINTISAPMMSDANGGSGQLLGLVEDIPLKFGHIRTPITAYVAENPPFDGLLGRPWQLAHKIGIEERDDGTYLTF